MLGRLIQLFALIFTLPLWADDLVTWKMALREAYANNPSIKAAEQAVKAAEATHKGAYSPFLPQLSATGSYTDSSTGVLTTSGGGGGSAFNNSSQSSYAVGLNVTQNIFNGFQTVGQIRQTEANLEAARAGLEIAKATVSSSLKTAFAELLYEMKSVDLALTILKRQETNLRLVQLRFEGGRENRGNLAYQEATVSQARYQYNHSGRNVRVAVKSVLALLGRPESESLKTEDDFDLPREPEKAEVKDFKTLALKNPNHLQAYYLQAAADAAVTIANQGWYPNINLTGFIGRSGPDFFPPTERWSVGVNLSFPFFPGTSQIFNTISALETERQTEFNVRNIDVGLMATLENAYGNLIDSIELVSVADEFKRAADARSRIGTEKYNTGLMTFDDWSVIETDAINRSQNLLMNKRNSVQAQATWENALGKGEQI